MALHNSHNLVALNADVVGYSALMADDVAATTEKMAAHRKLVDEQVAVSSGILVNFVGDSFMAVFDDATAALRAAIAIATRVEESNAGLPATAAVRFRMGMDEGTASRVGSDYLGEPLNVAARIQELAPPGGLAVSGRVYRALDEPALRFRPIGRQHLKNLPDRVEVFEFADLPTDNKQRGPISSLALEIPTVAILPTHTEMVDEVVAATAGMIRSDLVHRLSAIPELEVIDAPSEPTAASGSSARYMVETGVHQFGGSVRVFAALFDMDTMNVVKSHKWMTTTDELFELSEELAKDVAHSVEIELVVGEPARLYAELEDPLAIEKVYLGWYHLRNDTREGWHRALGLFGDVARSHPEEPYGFVLSGFAWWLGAANGWNDNRQEALANAAAFARDGASLGDPTGMARAVEAAVFMQEGAVDDALAKLEQLDIVRPTCDVTYGLEGSVRRYLGQWERAIELLDVAMGLTGINKPWYPTVKAASLFLGDRLEDAAHIASEVLEYQPRNLEALLVLTAAQAELGLERRARATADLIRDRFPTVDVQDWLDRTPYQRREVVERWKGDLVSAGAIPDPK